MKAISLYIAMLLTACGGGSDYCAINQSEMTSRVAEIRGKSIEWSQILSDAALEHAKDMAKTDIPTHRGTDGTMPADRAVRAGWISGYVGENLTTGYVNQSEVMRGWEESAGHRANLENKHYTHMGASCVQTDKGYGVYWVQVFGG